MERGTILPAAWMLAAACCIGGTASAAEASLDTIKLGEHWYGPEWKTEDLKGRVVLFEFWGIN
jgi:hypothetical protein